MSISVTGVSFSMKDKFEKLITEHPECITDKRLFLSYMKDIMPDERILANVLSALMELGIVEEIQQSIDLDIAFGYRFTTKLMENYGISEDYSARGVYLWCECYGHDILGKVNSTSEKTVNNQQNQELKGKLYRDLFTSTGPVVTSCTDKQAMMIVVPNVINGKDIKMIGDSAFAEMMKVEQAVISEGIIDLGDKGFYNCSNLKQAIQPEGLTKMGAYCYAECKELVTVNFPTTLRILGDYCLQNTHIREITFSKTITKYGRGICKKNQYLLNVNLSNNMTELPDEMFDGCRSLERLVIPEGLKYIGSRSLADCPGIPWIHFPNTIEYIADDAFEGHSNEFIIICDAGSYIEKYAREHRIKYQLG